MTKESGGRFFARLGRFFNLRKSKPETAKTSYEKEEEKTTKVWIEGGKKFDQHVVGECELVIPPDCTSIIINPHRFTLVGRWNEEAIEKVGMYEQMGGKKIEIESRYLPDNFRKLFGVTPTTIITEKGEIFFDVSWWTSPINTLNGARLEHFIEVLEKEYGKENPVGRIDFNKKIV